MEELLRHLCMLARLELTESEKEEFARKFEKVLAFVDEIKASKTDEQGVPLMVSKPKQQPAEDVPRDCELPQGFPRRYGVGRIGDLEDDGA